ncbi:MAG: ribonuclease III family protein [Candidatus Rokubacteria bacterium]|nr:ribonuclease III family protein [Candidatus Rokubacteria bacterium]
MDDALAAAVAALEARLGTRVHDRDLLQRALTHTSFANEHPPTPHQEALALVGDAALGLVVAEHLFAADPGAPVGVLTPRRAEIVSGANLARWATTLELGPLLRLGRGEDQTGGRTRESILATTLEAVLGVLYLQEGLEEVRRVVARLSVW